MIVKVHHKFHKFLQDSITFSKETKTFERITADENIDFLFSIGGDGTILSAIRSEYNNEKPILGIHVGQLGFLAEADTENLQKVLRLIKNNYKSNNIDISFFSISFIRFPLLYKAGGI